MSKKKFGLQLGLQQNLSSIIETVENNEGIYRSISIPLSQVEPDPKNPRDLSLTVDDIKVGIATDDPLLAVKKEELDSLNELAKSIKISGLINPITVIKGANKYTIVAGERRFLASLLAKKESIDVRVLLTKPNNFELKLIQWFENNARSDLSLIERIDNVREVVSEYAKENPRAKVTADLLGEIIGLSNSQALCYLALMHASQEIIDAIRLGAISNLDKAYLIASCKNENQMREAISMCSAGASLTELRKFLAGAKQSESVKAPAKKSINKINLGLVSQPSVIETIVNAVINLPDYNRHQNLFDNVTWGNPKDAVVAFKKLIAIIEME